MKTTVAEMENRWGGINRLVNMKEWISNLEDRIVDIAQSEQQKEEKISKNKDSLRDLCDNIKWPTICSIGIPEEKREIGTEIIFEEIIANYLI